MHRIVPLFCLVFALAVIGSFSMPWSEFLDDEDDESSQTGIQMLEGEIDVVDESSPIKDGAAQSFDILWGVLCAALMSAIGVLALFAPPVRRFGYMALPGGGMIVVAVLAATFVTGFPFENGVEVLTDDLRRAVANAPDYAKADANELIESMGTRRGQGFWIALMSGVVVMGIGWIYTFKVKVSDAVRGLGDDDGRPVDVREKYMGGDDGPVDVRHKYLAAGDPLLEGDDESGEWEYVDDDESGEWVTEDEPSA